MIRKKAVRNAIVASAVACAVGSFGFSTSEAYANTLASALAGGTSNNSNSFPSLNSMATYADAVAMGTGHVSGQGWQASQTGTVTLGTEGANLEAFKLQLSHEETTGNEFLISGNISYRVNDGSGWGEWVANGTQAGTTGQSGIIAAVQIALDGNVSVAYDVKYRAYVEGFGWLGWAENGDSVGTEGTGRAIQALQVELVQKDSEPTSANAYIGTPVVSLETTTDAREWSTAENGANAEGSVLLGVRAGLSGENVPAGSIAASAVVNGEWVPAEDAAGPMTQVTFSLDGDLSTYFDVQYRAYVSGRGWLGWAANGAAAGVANGDAAIEAVEVRVVAKGTALPEGGSALVDPAVEARSAALVAAAKSTPTTGSGFCARWISNVYQNAGLARPGGNANDMYWNFCTSSDRSELEPGMIVATPSHTWTSSGRRYGHVGIYIGDGLVMDSLYYVRTMTLDEFIADYSMLYEVKWGWAI